MPDPAASGPTHSSSAPSTAQTAIAARLQELFPDGRLPEPVAPGQTGPPASGESGPMGAASGPTGAASGPTGAASGPTGAASGPTGAPTTGATGALDAASGTSGASGPTAAQLDEASKKMDIKAGTAFKFVRDENAELKKTIAARDALIKEMAGKAPTEVGEAEVKELREKVTRYENALAISNVEATDAFQKDIAKPLVKAETDLKAIALKYEIAAGDLTAALANPDAIQRTDKLAELSANFNRLDLVRFDQLISKIDQLAEQRQDALADAAEKWKTNQQRQDGEAKAAASAFETSWKSALETAAAKLEKDGFFKPIGDSTDVELKKAQDEVRNLDVTKLSNDDLAERLYRAQAFPLLLNALSAALAENGAKDQEITKLRGATPPAGGGDVPAQTGATGVPQDASFRAVIGQRLHGVLPP